MEQEDWPEGSSYWITDRGRAAVISDPIAARRSDDGTWDFVTPSWVREHGTLISRDRFDALLAKLEQERAPTTGK